MLFKDDDEHPIPKTLRPTFQVIAAAFVDGDFQLQNRVIAGVRPVSADTAAWIGDNISAYGDALAALDDESWEGSVYRWIDGYWEMLVDLSTVSQPVSDLALHAKLYPVQDSFELEIYGVYVP